MVLDDGARAGHAARRRAAARRAGARRRADRQPARPALRLRDRARGGGALRRRACAAARATSILERGTATSRSTIEIDDLDGCPRYVGRLFRDVAIGESPVWLKARLRAAGVRAISNVVDVTNYVMLALGSPLHVFDFDTLHGGRVIVRRAREGEELRTLDGTAAQAPAGRPAHRRRRPRDRARRDHGRRGDRGLRADDLGAARGRELRAGRHPPQLRAARPAQRGLEPLGEGRRPARRRPGRDARHPADRRALRRALDRPRRRAGNAARARADPAPAGAHRRGARARGARRRAGGDPRQARLRGRARRLPRADLARARRRTRDRPDRGGRPLQDERDPVHAARAGTRCSGG